MLVLGMLSLSTADNSGMRLVLLALVLLAVVLLFTGSTIALLTLRNRRKASLDRITFEQMGRQIPQA